MGLDETLVAYLDGELDAEAARRVEARLAAEPDVQRRLHQLQRPWEMLDRLATDPLSDDFTHTTLEMVAATADEDARQQQDEAARSRRRRRWWKALGLLVAASAGFTTVALLRGQANRQLVDDLPIIRHLDTGRHAESVEFLRTLRERGLFVEEQE